MTGNDSSTDDRPLTIEEFERLPEGEHRTDLVRGRVVREPPAGAEHGWLDVRLACLVSRHVEEHALGVVFGAETGFILTEEPATVRAPDVAFVARERIPPEGLPRGFWRGAPDLAVEVASPSNTAAEIQAKVADYLAAGARLVWVVEPRTRSIIVHRPGGPGRLLWEDDALDGGGVLPGFRILVTEVFRR